MAEGKDNLADGSRKWAADLVSEQSKFCETCAEQESDPEQKKSDEESAEWFDDLSGKLYAGDELDNSEWEDVLWILHDAFHEIEMEGEVDCTCGMYDKLEETEAKK